MKLAPTNVLGTDEDAINITVFVENTTSSPTDEGHWISRLADSIILYATLPLVVVGTISNVLAFLVLIRKNLRSVSIFFYLLLLSCADLSVLYVSAFRVWFRFTFNWELIHESEFICKFLWFYLGVSLHMSAWLVVLVTFDRFLAIMFPLKAAMLCKPIRAGSSSFICFIFIIVYQAHLFVNVELQNKDETGIVSEGQSINGTNGTTIKKICAPLPDNYFMTYPFNSLKFVTYSLIPFLAVVVLNTCIICKLRNTGFTESNESSTPDEVRSVSRENFMTRTTSMENVREKRRVTVLLLTVSFSWLILSLPFSVISLVNTSGFSRYAKSVYYLIKVICFFLLWLNHSINFFLYCLSGTKFRSEINNLMC